MKAVLAFSIAMFVGCGSSGPGMDPDPDPDPDGPIGTPGLPSWQLEDVNPESPRVGQTYGLDSFNGKILVVTLLEGF